MSTAGRPGGEPIANRPWARVRLGEVCDLVNGDAYRSEDWSRHGIPIIRIQNLNDPSKPYNHWPASLDERVVVRDGDVLLAWSGTPGTSFGAHLWQRGVGLLNQHSFRVDLDRTRVEPAWAVFAINEQLGRLIDRAHGGVGLRHVTRKECDDLRILLPALPEQRRIAARLKEQLAALEEARAQVQAQLEEAEKLPAALLRDVFQCAEAQRWPRECVEDVCSLLPAKSIATAGDVEVTTVTTACLTETGFNPGGLKRARMWGRDAQIARLQPGEILIARSNTPELVGRASVFPGEPLDDVASDLTIRLLAGPRCEPEFVGAWFTFLFVSGYWRDRASGASGSMKKISRTQIAAENLPVPPRELQEEIAANLRNRSGEFRQLHSALTAQLADLSALPDALLREAFSGAP